MGLSEVVSNMGHRRHATIHARAITLESPATATSPILVGSTLTNKGVHGHDKMKKEDTFPFNDRSPLDGLSLDDMMISNQEKVPCKYTSALSKFHFYLLPILQTPTYRSGVRTRIERGTLSRIKREEIWWSPHGSFLHFRVTEKPDGLYQ